MGLTQVRMALALNQPSTVPSDNVQLNPPHPKKNIFKTPIPFLSRPHLERDGLGPKAHHRLEVDSRERSEGGVEGKHCFK